jgi:CRP-like cAMP-binding protein
MADHLRLKLEHYVRLSAGEREALASLANHNVRQVRARRDIIREGERPGFVNLIVDGWAIRHKMLEDGRRQILAFLIPGDMCDLNVFILNEMDHSIGALTEVTVAQVPREWFEDVEKRRPRLAQALNWDLLVQLAIQREWTINLGQRSAIERIAHLICELLTRLKAVGLCVDGSCHVPITQIDLSEATGITPVHVNRTLQELRGQGLIEWKGREITVPDMDALRRAAMFNENYLHLRQEGANLDAND